MNIRRSIRLLAVVLRAVGHTLTVAHLPRKLDRAATMIAGREMFYCTACDSCAEILPDGEVNVSSGRMALRLVPVGLSRDCPIFVAWRELGRSK